MNTDEHRLNIKRRVWRPLDVGRLRLYQVKLIFHSHPNWNEAKIVLAKSPSNAEELVEKAYEGSNWIEEPSFKGLPINVLQPKELDE